MLYLHKQFKENKCQLLLKNKNINYEIREYWYECRIETLKFGHHVY